MSRPSRTAYEHDAEHAVVAARGDGAARVETSASHFWMPACVRPASGVVPHVGTIADRTIDS